jgi:hypothetical protein
MWDILFHHNPTPVIAITYYLVLCAHAASPLIFPSSGGVERSHELTPIYIAEGLMTYPANEFEAIASLALSVFGYPLFIFAGSMRSTIT